jgi:hypothetical protein
VFERYPRCPETQQKEPREYKRREREELQISDDAVEREVGRGDLVEGKAVCVSDCCTGETRQGVKATAQFEAGVQRGRKIID